MKANHLRTKKMLIYGELEKYRILAESLLVGLLVGLANSNAQAYFIKCVFSVQKVL